MVLLLASIMLPWLALCSQIVVPMVTCTSYCHAAGSQYDIRCAINRENIVDNIMTAATT